MTGFVLAQIKSFYQINSSKSLIISILTTVGITGYYIQSFVINISFLNKGKEILELIKTQSTKLIDTKSESVGLNIIFIQFILVFAPEITFMFLKLTVLEEKFLIFKNFLIFIQFFSLLINISSIISLIAYQSKIISLQLNQMSVNFLSTDLIEIYRFICKVNTFVKKFDSLISSKVFMLIFNSSVICIAYLCLLTVDFKNKLFLVLCIISLLENILLLTALCYSCELIPKKIKIFCDKIEESMSEYVSINTSLNDLNNYLILSKINTIKQEIGFTAMGLFKVNSNAILSVFAVILSYSIVLIQTSSQC
jgi:hypothetical protein